MKTTATYESEGKQREFISAHSIHVTVPLVVTETSIFRETWYKAIFFLSTHETSLVLIYLQYCVAGIISVFLKVDVSCNGDHPVRILESKLKPSKIYAVENSSAVEEWDLVKNLKRYRKSNSISVSINNR